MRGGDPIGSIHTGSLSGVFPACAGVILILCILSRSLLCLPRMRGGDPEYHFDIELANKSSPHARG